jgi:hypothetical protein
MATPVISIERRRHPREGILRQLENIAYTILRKYSIAGETALEAASALSGTSITLTAVASRCLTGSARWIWRA